MGRSASFGIRKNSLEILKTISESFPNSIIVNVIGNVVDEEFEKYLKDRFLCVYDRNVEFLELPETTVPTPGTTVKPEVTTKRDIITQPEVEPEVRVQITYRACDFMHNSGILDQNQILIFEQNIDFYDKFRNWSKNI